MASSLTWHPNSHISSLFVSFGVNTYTTRIYNSFLCSLSFSLQRRGLVLGKKPKGQNTSQSYRGHYGICSSVDRSGVYLKDLLQLRWRHCAVDVMVSRNTGRLSPALTRDRISSGLGDAAGREMGIGTRKLKLKLRLLNIMPVSIVLLSGRNFFVCLIFFGKETRRFVSHLTLDG